MGDKVIIIKLETQEHTKSTDKGASKSGRDVWRFKEIRETLWGHGIPVKGAKNVWDFAGIRKRLWGK